MAEQIIQCSSECTVTVLLQSPWAALTIADAAQIGTSIVVVWAIAWGFRQVYRFIISPDYSLKKED